MRDSLSRIYYNYGQTLRKSGRVAEAAEQALERRVLWRDDADKLFGVALELAQLLDDEKPDEGFAEEIVSTLASALQAGYQPQVDLSDDERFRQLHDDEDFQNLLDPSKQQLAKSDTPQPTAP